MKTSTEWFEIRRKQINETHNSAPSKEFYEAIQLDAFKAGAEWAANIRQAKSVMPNGSKVNWKQVRKIRKMSLFGESQRYIAKQFGISQSAVSLIVNHKSFGLVRKQALRATGKVEL